MFKIKFKMAEPYKKWRFFLAIFTLLRRKIHIITKLKLSLFAKPAKYLKFSDFYEIDELFKSEN